MAVRLVEFSQRKMPRSKVGKFTTLTDVQEAIDHLQNLPAGKAIEVDINDADYTALKKDGTEDPARSIVNMLKRKFNNDGLAFKVYASSDKVLTIIKAESKPAPGKKK